MDLVAVIDKMDLIAGIMRELQKEYFTFNAVSIKI